MGHKGNAHRRCSRRLRVAAAGSRLGRAPVLLAARRRSDVIPQYIAQARVFGVESVGVRTCFRETPLRVLEPLQLAVAADLGEHVARLNEHGEPATELLVAGRALARHPQAIEHQLDVAELVAVLAPDLPGLLLDERAVAASGVGHQDADALDPDLARL